MRLAVLAVVAALAATPWAMGRPLASRPRRRRKVRSRGDRRRRPTGTVDPAVLLDLLDVALVAGASVPGALVALGSALPTGPTARALHAAGTSLRLGAPWREAWDGCPERLRPLASALEPAWSAGVDPCPLVRRAAAGIRARRQRAAREAAARLGARLVLPLGLCFLPAFVLLAMVPVLLSGGAVLLGE